MEWNLSLVLTNYNQKLSSPTHYHEMQEFTISVHLIRVLQWRDAILPILMHLMANYKNIHLRQLILRKQTLPRHMITNLTIYEKMGFFMHLIGVLQWG